MMVTRHMKEFGTTVEQMAAASVKNHINAYYNPYAPHPRAAHSHRPWKGCHARVRPSPRRLRYLHARLCNREREGFGRNTPVLQETLGSWNPLPGSAFLPRGSNGGGCGLQARRNP